MECTCAREVQAKSLPLMPAPSSIAAVFRTQQLPSLATPKTRFCSPNPKAPSSLCSGRSLPKAISPASAWKRCAVSAAASLHPCLCSPWEEWRSKTRIDALRQVLQELPQSASSKPTSKPQFNLSVNAKTRGEGQKHRAAANLSLAFRQATFGFQFCVCLIDGLDSCCSRAQWRDGFLCLRGTGVARLRSRSPARQLRPAHRS